MAHDDGLRVGHVEGEQGGQPGGRGRRRQPGPAPPERHRSGQQDEDPRHPGGEDLAVETQHGQPEGVLVEVESAQSDEHHHQVERHRRLGQHEEPASGGGVVEVGEGPKLEQGAQGDGGHGDELEESGPGVLGVGQAGGLQHADQPPKGGPATFWELVGECLKPRGRVFFADDAYRTDGELVQGPDSPMIERRLEDGTRFRLVKVPHSAAGLERRLRELRWAVKVHETAGPFYWGAGTPM